MCVRARVCEYVLYVCVCVRVIHMFVWRGYVRVFMYVLGCVRSLHCLRTYPSNIYLQVSSIDSCLGTSSFR